MWGRHLPLHVSLASAYTSAVGLDIDRIFCDQAAPSPEENLGESGSQVLILWPLLLVQLFSFILSSCPGGAGLMRHTQGMERAY